MKSSRPAVLVSAHFLFRLRALLRYLIAWESNGFPSRERLISILLPVFSSHSCSDPLSLSLSLSVCQFLSLCFSFSLYVFLSFSFSLCLSGFLSLCLSLPLSLSVCLTLNPCLSFSVSFCLSVSLSLYLVVSLSLMVQLSSSLSIWSLLTLTLWSLFQNPLQKWLHIPLSGVDRLIIPCVAVSAPSSPLVLLISFFWNATLQGRNMSLCMSLQGSARSEPGNLICAETKIQNTKQTIRYGWDKSTELGNRAILRKFSVLDGRGSHFRRWGPKTQRTAQSEAKLQASS